VSARYAVYLAPAPDSALWRFGSRVLGRDAATGEAVHGFAPAGLSSEAWRALTAEPRRYGFHATLKAPFRLKHGFDREPLEEAVARIAASTDAFDLGPLEVVALTFAGGAFVALTPVRAPPALRELEARAVRDLDAFRAPPTDAELKRRKPERLTPRQRHYLNAWGYPYVLDEFRLHFTLTGAVAPLGDVLARLDESFTASVSSNEFRVDALALFVQEEGADFHVVKRFCLKQT
jgi:putative phosphonate metabolism protein